MNPQQFLNAVKELQDGLRRFLLALCCGDSSRADDLAQEALIKAYLGIGTLKNQEMMKSWLYRIAYRCFIDSARRAVLNLDISEAAGMTADRSTEADSNFRYQELHRALRQLGPRDRSVIILFYFEGYSTSEIAQMTGTTDAAVRKQLSRGRIELKKYLKNFHNE